MNLSRQITIPLAEFNTIYSNGRFTLNYHYALNSMVKREINREISCNKTFAGKNSISIYVQCKTCKSKGKVTTMLAFIGPQDVKLSATFECDHGKLIHEKLIIILIFF
jgi:RecJ-like exonuclease